MKNFRVIVHYAGACDFEIKANSEEQAEEKAYTLFEETDDRDLVANLDEVNVCDCWEV